MNADDARSFTVPKECHRLRVDRFLRERLKGASRGDVLRMLLAGRVTVAGRRLDGPDHFLKRGELLTVDLATPETGPATAGSTALVVLHDDEHLVAIDKPVGLASLPTPDGDRSARSEFERMLGVTLFPVHRLDRVTSGVLLFARTSAAAAKISLAFQHHRVEKRYVAIALGRFPAAEGVIDAALKSQPSSRTGRIDASPGGRRALTHYRVLNERAELTMLELVPKTGRRHQLRAHLAHLERPILGDRLYGGAAADRVYLHAASIRLQHPAGATTLTVEAPLPLAFHARFPPA